MPIFKNKRGQCTRYALACGYIDLFEANGYRMTLWLDGTFHVRMHDHGTDDHQGSGRVFWECFETLTEARAHFNKSKRIARNQGK